ncbi:FAD-binding domain-containing protein [Glacieibacterium frigidum]|uniref:Cryptochrome/DNA photolyase FAD-binding domain-containing protein n=1 Tax=Glacieibacterium frigidum TaxID=2593303 RepID=A0A552UHT1_9SPHN|nr:FAD-binding domain-containing protein [Glacieibacterium frigidum]TRW17783.1 hypothetical protein FMM06_06505 [Glacieibacterium frigidum]
MLFTPTRAAALATLAAFVDRAGRDYAETRNFDHGPGERGNVSGLSLYLRYRLVTEDEVVAAVRARHPGQAADKFVQEVIWRSYWKGWLELRPSVWTDYLGDVARLEGQSGGWRRDYERALVGRTGIDCFDAWIAELAEHGYLHNHARMWFASIWIFTLNLPWQLGAALFEHHLFDGDPASNTLSWRWVAGLQTVGKTYLATAGNIARYTGGRFVSAGLATQARPIAGPPVPPAGTLAAADPRPTGRVGLLIGEDDLSPETLDLGGLEIAAVAGLGQTRGRAAAVETFVRDALDDACGRAAAAWQVPATALTDATPATVAKWASAHGLDRIVVAHAPVGPGAQHLAEITQALQQQGITVSRIRRPWDERAWPHATRGYFAFRERFQA